MKQKRLRFLKRRKQTYLAVALVGVLAIGAMTGCSNGKGSSSLEESSEICLRNASYDSGGEFFAAFDAMFAEYWEQETGQEVEVVTSGDGSGIQAENVAAKGEADVVTLATEQDVKKIEEAGLIREGWQEESRQGVAPYTSTIVFLVKAGNEKEIEGWGDLVKKDVEVVMSNPKTSGGGCWSFLGAWAYARQQYGDDEKRMVGYMKKLYQNVLVLEDSSKEAVHDFSEIRQGDVLVTWENEAYLAMEAYPEDFEIVVPGVSVLAQPAVAVVDSVVEKDGNKELARKYLEYLYSEEGQRLAADYYLRPVEESILQEYTDIFPTDNHLMSIEDLGGWEEVHEQLFAAGGVFDQVYSE